MVLLIFGLGANHGFANDCHTPRFTFLDNSDTPVTMRVGKNNQCVFPLTWSFGMESINVTEQPKHGAAGFDQTTRPRDGQRSILTTIIYKPARGYVGKDFFVAHASYFRQGDVRFETTLKVDVDVVTYNEEADAVDALAAAGAGSGVDITYGWSKIATMVSPAATVDNNRLSTTLRLSNGNQTNLITFRNGKKTATRSGRIGVDIPDGDGTLRTDVSAGAIVIIQDNASFQTVTRIHSNGKSSCSATREYRLKPGRQLFEWTGDNKQNYSASAIAAEDVTCSIAARN